MTLKTGVTMLKLYITGIIKKLKYATIKKIAILNKIKYYCIGALDTSFTNVFKK